MRTGAAVASMPIDSLIPVTGFFCNGEIGPVGERNFLHGFTASIALVIPEESGQGLPIEEVTRGRRP